MQGVVYNLRVLMQCRELCDPRCGYNGLNRSSGTNASFERRIRYYRRGREDAQGNAQDCPV